MGGMRDRYRAAAEAVHRREGCWLNAMLLRIITRSR